MGLVDKLFGSYSAKELKRIRPQVDAVLALEDRKAQYGKVCHLTILFYCTPGAVSNKRGGKAVAKL